MLFERVSFQDLRWFYANCSVALFAGDDKWEPAGITSLMEALACGALCVCNAGGYIEKELRGLAAARNFVQPVQFYEWNNRLSLVSSVQKILRSPQYKLTEMSIRARDFVKTMCPV